MNDQPGAGKGEITRFTNKDWGAMTLVVALVFLTYACTLTSSYGMRDDYYFLQNGIDGNKGTIELLVGAGRPLNGWLLHLGFSAAGSIGNMAALRGITLVGIALLGCGLYAYSRAHRLTVAASLAMAAATVLLPSFQVYAAWTQHFTTPFAGILGVIAAYLVSPARAGNERVAVGTIVSAILCLAAAVLVYQPTAMFFFTGLLISVFASSQLRRDWALARFASSGVVFGTAMVIGFVALKVGQRLYPSGGARYGLLNDPLGKAKWFFEQPLCNVLSLYVVPGSKPVAIACAVVLSCGLIFYFIRQKSRTGTYAVFLAILCLLGSYLPNLATGENWASYRSTGALAASIAVLLAALVIEPVARRQPFWSASQQRASGNASKFVGVGLLLFIAVTVQSNVSNGLVLPNVVELDNLTSQMKSVDVDNVRQILVHPSAWSDSAARPMAYDEFGLPSSVTNYYAGAMVDLVRKSLGILDDADITIVEKVDAAAQATETGQVLTVDFVQLATSGRFKAVSAHALSAKVISLENISDDNWTNGIWTNRQRPNDYSFVYRKSQNGATLKTGDRVIFAKSGERVVVRVDNAGDYRNVFVDGPPLGREDGYPATVTVAKRAKAEK